MVCLVFLLYVDHRELHVRTHAFPTRRSSDLSQRAWGFAMHHRQRLVIGNPPGVLSFGAWPIMPAIDKRVLKVVGGLPAGVLTERRAQDDMIRSNFPAQIGRAHV